MCLGALGRYASAARYLLPGGLPAGSAAASCRASHLRQLGRHAEAEPLDRYALATAEDAEARADALVGLVADAVGRLDLPAARDRLAAAAGEIAGHAEWRAPIRLAWVEAEVALLADRPAEAVAAAGAAVHRSREVVAWRHAVKSELVLGAALEAAGRFPAAARVLRGAAARAERLDLLPLVWPARTLRATILSPRAPAVAARERRRAASAIGSIESSSDGRTSR